MDYRISKVPAGDVAVGQVYGPFRYDFAKEHVAAWNDIGVAGADPAGEVPAGLMSVYFLKALIDGFDGVPEGAVLVHQLYDYFDEPEVGRPVEAELEVVGKSERTASTRIVCEMRVTQDGVPVATSQLTLRWGIR